MRPLAIETEMQFSRAVPCGRRALYALRAIPGRDASQTVAASIATSRAIAQPRLDVATPPKQPHDTSSPRTAACARAAMKTTSIADIADADARTQRENTSMSPATNSAAGNTTAAMLVKKSGRSSYREISF